MPLSGHVEDRVTSNAAPVNASWVHTQSPMVGPPPRVQDGTVMQSGDGGDDESWLVTLVFLMGLVLFGIVTGYLMRGGSANGSELAAAMPSPLASIVQDDARLAISSGLPEMNSFGSDAPDELLGLVTRQHSDGVIGLVQTHNTRENSADRISFVSISDAGLVEETELAVGQNLGQASIAEGMDGRSIAAIVNEQTLLVQNLSGTGRFGWSRRFPIHPGHDAKIDIASFEHGSVIVGPGEREDRINLIHLASDGDLIWQRSFSADAERPDLKVTAADDGSVFVVIRNMASGTPQGSHALMRIEAEGQIAWKRQLDLGDQSSVAGLELSSDGHVHILSSGMVPSLAKYDLLGELVWLSPVPDVSQQDALFLVPGDAGNMIVASPYSMLGQRLYVSMQHWDKAGVIVGNKELTLPADSSLDVLSVSHTGDLVMGGSVLPNRYDDADIYFTKSTIDADQWESRSLVSDSLILSLETQSGEAVTVEASTVPTSPILTEAVTQPREVVPAAVVTPDVFQPAVAIETDEITTSSVEDGSVALSTFVDWVQGQELGQRAQCRFTCLEQRGGATFPMWASVDAGADGASPDLNAIHSQVCLAARGRIFQEASPDCRFIE